MEDAWARDLYPTEESSILFGTKKNLSKDRWRSPLPWMSWLNIMVPKTKKTPYLRVAIAIDPDSPRRIKSKNTFKRHGVFSHQKSPFPGPKSRLQQRRRRFLIGEDHDVGHLRVGEAIRQHIHRWGLLKPWNKLKFDLEIMVKCIS